MPPFTSRYPTARLPDIVGTVALAADPDHPEIVSQRAWDAARIKTEFRDAPSARAICDRLGMSWPEVTKLAQTAVGERRRRVGRGGGDYIADWLTPENAIAALRLVARSLGVTELGRDAYARERTRMLAADRPAYRHGRQLLLPTADQILSLLGWPEALSAAGLSPGRAGVPTGARRAVPVIDLLDLCYDAHGTLPTKMEMRAFTTANALPYHFEAEGRSWKEIVDEWKARRRERGEVVPDGPPPKDERPNYRKRVLPPRPGEEKPRGYWDKNEQACVEAVAAFLAGLGPGDSDGSVAYARWTRKPGRPEQLDPQPLPWRLCGGSGEGIPAPRTRQWEVSRSVGCATPSASGVLVASGRNLMGLRSRF